MKLLYMTYFTITNLKKQHQNSFIDDLLNEINHQKNIQLNHKLFIKNRGIKLYTFTKSRQKITTHDLPIQTLIGSVFLIKGNNILEFYSYCDNNHSLYMQLNVKKPLWIGIVDIIFLHQSDPENIKFLLDGYQKFFIPSNFQYFIMQFLQSGFQLYLK